MTSSYIMARSCVPHRLLPCLREYALCEGDFRGTACRSFTRGQALAQTQSAEAIAGVARIRKNEINLIELIRTIVLLYIMHIAHPSSSDPRTWHWKDLTVEKSQAKGANMTSTQLRIEDQILWRRGGGCVNNVFRRGT